ncbi:hypothetical protein [Mycetohabitans rhizoxinica]|uniref:hypothetical protein n=1 Tax=Mycetohabitans rhizoxinica TaxID=412963 RepID=UPI0030CCF64E
MPDWIGYRWLAEHFGVEAVQPLRIDSQLAKSRSTERVDGVTHEFYPAQFKPVDTLAGHMTFAFKREGIHLESWRASLTEYRRLSWRLGSNPNRPASTPDARAFSTNG